MHHFALGANLIKCLSLAIFIATLNIDFLPTSIIAGQLHTLQTCCHVEEEIAVHSTDFGNAHGMVYCPGSKVFAQFWKQQMLRTNLTHIESNNLCFRIAWAKFSDHSSVLSVSTRKCRNMSVNNIKTNSHRNVVGASQIFVQMCYCSQPCTTKKVSRVCWWNQIQRLLS